MALTTTTLTAACSVNDLKLSVTLATGFAAGSFVQVDQEFVRVAKSYVSGLIIPLDGRGLNGTLAAAHPITANATAGTGTDWATPSAAVVVSYPLAARRRNLMSYTASGAITLPTAGSDMVAVLNSTSALTMTLAAPGKDLDGSIVYIIGNGKSASTIAFDATNGLGNAGSGYDLITFQTGGQVCQPVMACNGFWVALNAPITGTSAAISVAVS